MRTPKTQRHASSEHGTAPSALPPKPRLSSREVELKLLAPAHDLATLERAPVIEAHARNRGITRRLEAVYWDTDDRALLEAGFTLRVRRSGSRFIQTVKSTGPVGGDLLARSEWETPVGGFTPDVAALAPDLPAQFVEAAGSAPLEPMFSAEVKRRARKLDLPTAIVEIAFDEGRIVAGARAAGICEIELELVQGDPAVLYDVALALLDHGKVAMSMASKSSRGFDLALGRSPAPAKAAKPEIRRDASLDMAISSMLPAALRHLVENAPAALDGNDAEGVHQVRVALRRLRTLLAMLAKLHGAGDAARLSAEAKWLASEHGEARNWDVFLGETLPPVEAGCGDGEGFAALRETAKAMRSDGYAAARRALLDKRSQAFQLSLGRWICRRGWREEASPEALTAFDAPAADFAAAELERQHRKALKRGRRFAKLDPEERHEVRLAVKKLRYSSEFLLGLCAGGGKAAAYAKALARLQDGLGRYNDMATTGTLLDRISAAGDQPPCLREACGMVRGWQARDAEIVEGELRARWKQFAAARRPWTK